MTMLIDGYSLLKSTAATSSPFNGGQGSIVHRWRLCFKDAEYVVHLEQLFPNGGSAEGLLYRGDSLDAANAVYARYTDHKRSA